MLPHRDISRLQDMLGFACEAQQFIENKTKDELKNDRLLELSLTRLLELIGEAASKISEETRKKYHQIPWRHAIEMRNRLIHNYGNIDKDILWSTIINDIPPLIIELQKILQ